MNKRVVRRLLETFFRRWWLYALPMVLFALVGVAKAGTTRSGFESAGTIDVSNSTVLSQLTKSNQGGNVGFDTPATTTARTVNSLLATDQFVDAIATQAGLTTALKSGQLTRQQLRADLSVTPGGDSLVRFGATTDNPELSSRLAKGAMDSYVQYVVNDNVSESQTAEQFFEGQLPTYLQQLQTAQAALADYAAKHPGGSQEQRPLDEQIQIQQLTSAISQAQTQYTGAQQKIEEARLSTETAKSDTTQKLRVIDEPQTPSAPAPRITKAVTTVIIFMFVGFLLTCAAVVLGSVLDRSLRSADDVEELLHLPVLGVVPDAAKEIHRRDRRHKKKRSERGDQAEPSRTERPQRPSIAPTGADTRRGRGAARTPSADDRSRSSRGSAAVESTTGGSRNDGSSSKELS
jgi:uncharacterized protein involved in exopolysaccharide biosynthesis